MVPFICGQKVHKQNKVGKCVWKHKFDAVAYNWDLDHDESVAKEGVKNCAHFPPNSNKGEECSIITIVTSDMYRMCHSATNYDLKPGYCCHTRPFGRCQSTVQVEDNFILWELLPLILNCRQRNAKCRFSLLVWTYLVWTSGSASTGSGNQVKSAVLVILNCRAKHFLKRAGE